MNCLEVKSLLSPYQDNELSLEIRQKVEDHLHGCQYCRRELAQLERLVEEIKGMKETDAPPRFSSMVMSKIRNNQHEKQNHFLRWTSSFVYVMTFVIFLAIGLWINMNFQPKERSISNAQSISNLLIQSQDLNLLQIQDKALAMITREVRSE